MTRRKRPRRGRRAPSTAKRRRRVSSSPRNRSRSPGAGWESLVLWGGIALVGYLIMRSRSAAGATRTTITQAGSVQKRRTVNVGGTMLEGRYLEIDGQCVDSYSNSPVDPAVCSTCDTVQPGDIKFGICFPGG